LIQVVIGFLSGGAFGALIKQYFDNRRARIQSIEYSIKLMPYYNPRVTQLENTQMVFKNGTNEYEFPDLYIGTIEIINTGLNDYPIFPLGLTLVEGGKFIQCKLSTTNSRHHIAELINEPTITNQTTSFDIKLKPFNRKNRYVFDVHLTNSNLPMLDSCFQLCTSKPVKLTKISPPSETISIITEMTTKAKAKK